MKGLGQFRRFDWENFSIGKTYQVVGIADWMDMSIAMVRSTPTCMRG